MSSVTLTALCLLAAAGAGLAGGGVWGETVEANSSSCDGTAPSASRPLVFIHVPKCGGTSVHTLLWQIAQYHQVDEQLFCDSLDLPRQLYQDKSTVEPVVSCAIVVGHLAYGLADGYAQMQPAARYVTLVRDPIERTVSLYNYAISHPEHFQHRCHPWFL